MSKPVVFVGLMALVFLAAGGCAPKTSAPAELGGQNVQEAADRMARSLIETIGPVRERSVVVFAPVMDNTTSRQNLNIFISALRTRLSRLDGGERILIRENLARLDDVRSMEVRGAPRPVQGGPLQQAPPGESVVDYFVYAEIYDLVGRRKQFMQFDFRMVDQRSGVQIWSDSYEVDLDRR